MLPVDASAGLNQVYAAGERGIFRGGLKVFLAKLHRDYFLGKALDDDLVFDCDLSKLRLRQFIAKERKFGSITRAEWRRLRQEINEIDANTVDGFCRSLEHTETLLKRVDYYDRFVKWSPNPQGVGFWKIIWPEFLREIGQ